MAPLDGKSDGLDLEESLPNGLKQRHQSDDVGMHCEEDKRRMNPYPAASLSKKKKGCNGHAVQTSSLRPETVR